MGGPRFSAGLLPFRRDGGVLEVFIVHMAGPYWEAKDDGAWSIAKGEYDPVGEEPQAVARREFAEEVGRPPPQGVFIDVGESRLPSGKRLRTYAVETGEALAFVESNLFEMEWPPRSGRKAWFPEVDRADWFRLDVAALKLVGSQVPVLDALRAAVTPD